VVKRCLRWLRWLGGCQTAALSALVSRAPLVALEALLHGCCGGVGRWRAAVSPVQSSL